jgi:phosphatidylinositol alpha-1,6-mannosyltransferase
MTGASSLCGGIHTANLNVLHALVELADEIEGELRVLSYLEREEARPQFLPKRHDFRAFEGNKFSFVLNLISEARKRPIICFDHVTLALPILPLAASGLAKTVIFAHGSESWRRVRKLSRSSFQNATLCLTNSDFTLKKMRERIPKFNGVACPLGLSPEIALNSSIPTEHTDQIGLEAADGISRKLGCQVLLLVGRMHPGEREKGHRPLINVLPQLLKQFPDVQLVFAGPGDDRENLRDLARGSGVGHAVFLPGFLAAEELNRLYQHCYAFVMPSLQEGFGLAYLEAMNYGKPCVGCFDQGAEDIIVDQQTGFLVRTPDDSDELLGILSALLNDPERARTLGRNGFERLHTHFTSDQYQQRIKEQIARVL